METYIISLLIYFVDRCCINDQPGSFLPSSPHTPHTPQIIISCMLSDLIPFNWLRSGKWKPKSFSFQTTQLTPSHLRLEHPFFFYCDDNFSIQWITIMFIFYQLCWSQINWFIQWFFPISCPTYAPQITSPWPFLFISTIITSFDRLSIA